MHSTLDYYLLDMRSIVIVMYASPIYKVFLS